MRRAVLPGVATHPMSIRLPFLLLGLMLLLPLAGLGWLGWNLGLEQEHAWRRELNAVLGQRLADIRRQAEQPLRAIARRVDQVVGAETAAGRGYGRPLAERLRQLPFAEQVLVLGPGGDRRYPTGNGRNAAERAFVQRTASLWRGKALLHAGDGAPEGAIGSARRSGWMAWHWEQGIDLLYWRRDDAGAVAVSVDAIGLLADMIAVLPDAGADRRLRVQLRDASGKLLYQWGGYRPPAEQRPRVSSALSPPLDFWNLALFFDDSGSRIQGGRLRTLQLAVGLVALALVLLGLGLWLFRELRRTQREAAERVNFVNQVSHELRTPLTNIRMYAELLADDLDDDPGAQRKLDVIVAESRRLGRLIGNVLSFARKQKNSLRLHPVEARLDELVADTLDQFRPGLAARGIELSLHCATPRPVLLDPDAVTGMLGNLLSNAEKYAPQAALAVTTRERDGQLVVRVHDRGPGIPRRQRRRVFRPFFRVTDKVTEGVSGTGIGLAIARDLARLHGGDLRLLDSRRGALFELTLPLIEVPR